MSVAKFDFHINNESSHPRLLGEFDREYVKERNLAATMRADSLTCVAEMVLTWYFHPTQDRVQRRLGQLTVTP